MAGFRLLDDPYVGHSSREVTISSLTLAVGDLLELDIGATAWTAADASTTHWQKKAVCVKSTTSSDTLVEVVLVLPGQVYAVESANASNVAHNGDRMILTDRNTVNNTGTDNTTKEAVFIQKGVDSGLNTTTIIGEIIAGSGINPDAT